LKRGDERLAKKVQPQKRHTQEDRTSSFQDDNPQDRGNGINRTKRNVRKRGGRKRRRKRGRVSLRDIAKQNGVKVGPH
jgi:hypothetical protein